ncbi:unnamed protein product [Clonostachys rosea]|uniref:alpha-L-rhamnosidase n=1 Tax=Bionectria ochroleuca TaxID=29856 RepID=A0ABY6TXS5_BIOOC|nr:unnamed protein product [Clonostachys rosea]
MSSAVQITDLRFEHHPNGLGVPTASPRLSWRFDSNEAHDQEVVSKSWFQFGYEIQTRRLAQDPSGNSTSFQVRSGRNAFVPWPDVPLVSREQALVRVRVFGGSSEEATDDLNQSDATDWTEWHTVEASLLAREDWEAQAITTQARSDKTSVRPIRLRKTFHMPETPRGARGRLYISALGIYEAFLNGKRIGTEYLSPGWTSFHHRIQYQVYDVGPLLFPGRQNTLAIEVASGMYAGRMLWNDEYKYAFYGDQLFAFAQLELISDDGSKKHTPHFRLATDSSWEGTFSPLLESSIYDGETYALEHEEDGWNDAPVPSALWQPAVSKPLPHVELLAAPTVPIKITQEVRPTSIFRSPSGKVLVDFGQNLVGKILVRRLRRPDGHHLTIRHAEVLEHGELGTRPLRTARATDEVIFGGGRGLVDWSPRFTYHGFRYAEIDNWAEDDDLDPLTVDAISALVMHSDLERTGYFECSNAMVNRLHENVVWSTRGNMFSIPTDCPQRDERLGWTGDIQVFCSTAAFLFNVDGILSNWMRDLVADQEADGGIVPLVVPDVKIPWPTVPQAIWDDVVVILPWTMYTWFGNKQILMDSYSSMKMHLDQSVRRGTDGLWDPSVWQLGDWLDPGAPSHDPGLARTNGTMVADQYLIHITGIMARISRLLGYTADASRYESALENLRRAFQHKYIAPSGLIVGDTQTAIALSLCLDVYSESESEKRETAARRLGNLVRYAQYRVSTGFAGTRYILHALSDTDQLQLAYRMLLEDQCPSWLYPVKMGATTIWERWDSMLDNGDINPGEMTSFNHYALGSVASWLHAVVGGLSPLEPGWRRFKVRPRPGGDIQSAEVRYLSSCGLIKCTWEVGNRDNGESFHLSLRVPENSHADIVLPDGQQMTVGSGNHSFRCKYTPEGPWPPKPLRTAFRDMVES